MTDGGAPPRNDDAGARPDATTLTDSAIPGIDAGPQVPDELHFVSHLADPFAPAIETAGRAFLRSSRHPETQPEMGNYDYNNFLEVLTGGTTVLVDEQEAGVITRMWFTLGPPPFATGDSARLRIWVDGEELPLDPDPRGATLARLTSGDVPGFPRPWVMGRDTASGAFMINVPIPYRESLRVELHNEPLAAIYYQVDGHTLDEAPRASFTVPPPAGYDAMLGRALGTWRDHVGLPGILDTQPLRPLRGGDELVFSATGPGVITTVDVTSSRDSRSALELEITIDGEIVAHAPVGWLTGGSAPANDYASSLTGADAQHAYLWHPMPYAQSARIRVLNSTSTAFNAGLRVRHADGVVLEHAGGFHASCSSAVVDIPGPSLVDVWEPTVQYPNVVVGGALSGRGWYVGQSFYLYSPTNWRWALENDHEVFVDGEYPVLGTGTEDYFGGAFYFVNGPFASILSGATGWLRGPETQATTHVYRHHLLGGIPFEREFRFEYESYIDDTRWDGCVFWYRAP